MKKSIVGPLIMTIIILLIGAMFVYFYISLNRMDKRITAVQTTIVNDSSKIGAIVNFFNSTTNAKTTTK